MATKNIVPRTGSQGQLGTDAKPWKHHIADSGSFELISGSLTPDAADTYDLGTASKFWRDLYVSSGSIKFIDPSNNKVITTLGLDSDGNQKISGSFLPDADNTYDLGSSGKEWKDIYIDGTANIDSLAMGTTVTSIADEDDLSSNSATALATQQSIKAYVDTQITAEDLDVSSDSGTIAIDLDSETFTIAGGTGITTSATSNTLTITSAITAGDGLTLNTADIDLDAALTTVTSIYNSGLAIGYGSSHANIDFGTDNAIIFDIDGTQQLKLTDGVLAPITDNDIDLGTSTLEFKDAFFDGTVTSDAFAGPLTGDVTGNADTSTKIASITNSNIVQLTSSQTLTNKTLTSPVLNGTLSGTAFLDEDNFSSNSAIAAASQQSIKAYVDTQITAEDLDVSSDSGTIDIDLDSETLTVAGGAGIDTSASGTTITIAGEDSTAANKGIVIVAGGTNATVGYSSGTATVNVDDAFLKNDANDETSGTITAGGFTTTATGSIAYVKASDEISGSISQAIQTGITTMANLTTVGTIGSGTWEGTTVAVAQGGTGATTLNNLITLGTHTTGNYVATLTAGALIDLQNNSGETASPTIDVDLTEAGEAAIANGDYILFLDGGATGTHAKEAIADVATLFAGTGLTATNSVIAIDAAQTGITSLLAADIKIGEDDQTKIDFETADTINFYASNEKQLILTDGALTPGSNAIVDLGTDALEFKDAYFDGTVEADAITIGGSTLASVIQGTTVDNATLAATTTVTDSTANTNFPIVLHDESNALLDDTGTFTYNPSTSTLVVPNINVSGTQTFVNTASLVVTSSVIFEGATDDGFETTLTVVDPTADRTWTLQNATDTVVGRATTDTLTNKSIDLDSNTLSGTVAEFNSALQSDSFATLANTVTLTNKTLTSPDINTPDIDGGTIDGATIATSDVTVGSGKTLDVSGGTLTTSAAQKEAIMEGAGANIDIGSYSLTAQTLVSDVSTGTAPLTVSSTTAVSNLNADLLDGQHGSYYLDFGNFVIDNDEIPIAKLASDSVSYGGVSVTLGSSDATPAFDLSDATAYPGDSSLTTTGTVTSGVWNSTFGTTANSEISGAISAATASMTGNTNITTVGTIGTGTWQGSSISTTYTDAKVTSIVAGDGIDVSGVVVLFPLLQKMQVLLIQELLS